MGETLPLGVVHRRVGTAQDVVRVSGAILRVGDANARPDRERAPFEGDRSAERCGDALGDGYRSAVVGEILGQDGELVAAEPGRGVLGPYGLLDPPGDLAQYLVTGLVA